MHADNLQIFSKATRKLKVNNNIKKRIFPFVSVSTWVVFKWTERRQSRDDGGRNGIGRGQDRGEGEETLHFLCICSSLKVTFNCLLSKHKYSSIKYFFEIKTCFHFRYWLAEVAEFVFYTLEELHLHWELFHRIMTVYEKWSVKF